MLTELTKASPAAGSRAGGECRCSHRNGGGDADRDATAEAQLSPDPLRPSTAPPPPPREYPWDVRRLLAEQDILGLPFAEEYGGTGTGTLMLQVAVEEIAKACASSALILMVQELGTLPIQLFGTDEQKERFLPRCATGEWSPAFALSEPEAGSDPRPMRTTAVRDGDEWVINGAKNWITNAGDRRLLRRLRRHRPREPPDQRLHRRERPPGFRSPASRAQARDQGVAHRPARCSRTCASRPRT